MSSCFSVVILFELNLFGLFSCRRQSVVRTLVTNSLVALWPLVPFDVINFVKTFQQYSFLVTGFFFRKETISHVGFSLIFYLIHTTRRKVYKNSQYRNPYVLNCSQSKYTEAFPVSLSLLSCPEECDMFFL